MYFCGFIVVCHQVDVEKPEEVRLIDLDETHSGEHTVFIMPPEEPQEADGSECPALYRYRVTVSEVRNVLTQHVPACFMCADSTFLRSCVQL